MSDARNKEIARQFIKDIFNGGRTEQSAKFVTADILYHGAEEVRGIDDFKEWISEDRKALPDMEVTILDEIEEQNKVAIRWNLKSHSRR